MYVCMYGMFVYLYVCMYVCMYVRMTAGVAQPDRRLREEPREGLSIVRAG